MVPMSKKCLIKNLNLIDLNKHRKIGLIGSVQDEIKCQNPKNVYFDKKGAIDKKITFLLFIPAFLNFAYKMKTG